MHFPIIIHVSWLLVPIVLILWGCFIYILGLSKKYHGDVSIGGIFLICCIMAVPTYEAIMLITYGMP
jgi:hypothetical protein